MNKLSKIFLIIIVILVIGFCTMVALYFNLKNDYKKLESELLFSQNGDNVNSNLNGDFLFSEEGK